MKVLEKQFFAVMSNSFSEYSYLSTPFSQEIEIPYIITSMISSCYRKKARVFKKGWNRWN